MPKCFIIQPFDEKYQKLYKDVYRPAIEATGVEPYKVDDDPSVNVPIEAIEKQIRDCDFCFAEISEDNPNVWYELGYALASNIPFCIVCSKQKRETLPFDIRHRNVLFYDADSPSDFLNLQRSISQRMEAIKKEATVVTRIAKGDSKEYSEGELQQHELTALALIAAQQIEANGSTSLYGVRNSISKAGYTEIAFALAFNKFESNGLVEVFDDHDDYNQENYRACRLTDAGWALVKASEGKLRITTNSGSISTKRIDPAQDFDDEIPF